ncbi:MAG: glycosyltransferase, partial [Solirubrobacteraceae bacterium]
MTLTVIIPAHDEEAVIGACLTSLVHQDIATDVQVVVVANGCRDATAAVAQGFGPALRRRGFSVDFCEIVEPSKPTALNIADSLSRHGDRVYLDADVDLSSNALSS